MDIRIIGITDQQEAYVGSKTRKFRINEFLIIEDRNQGDIFGEVVKVNSYNRYIPMNMGGELADKETLDSIQSLGFGIDEDTIYIAKIRLLKESDYPIEVGSTLRIPSFDEVRNYFIPSHWKSGLNMGIIRNTEDIYKSMDEELKDLVKIYEDGLQEQRDIPYIYNLHNMHHYPHIGVFGGSGSGKSFGLRVMLEELMRLKIPSIVLDPHYEMDFSNSFMEEGMEAAYGDAYQRFRVGRDIGVKFNEMDSGDFKRLLSTSSRLSEAMESVVDTIFQHGMTLVHFEERLEDLIKAQNLGGIDKIRQEMENAFEEEERKYYKRLLSVYEKYNDKCPQSSVSGIKWRYSKLKYSGIFNKDIKPVLTSLQEGKLAVIQGSTSMIQVFSTYLISYIYNLRRDYKDSLMENGGKDYFPPFVIVTDEAHNFAPQTKDAQRETPSKYVLREISQEGRKYGVFLILATQRPSLLDSTITAQLNTKFIFRTSRATDIDTIKDETDLSAEEGKRLPYLQTGDVFVSESSIGRTVFVRIRAAHTRSPHTENPFDELVARFQEHDDDFYEMIEELLPIQESDLLLIAREIEEKFNKTYSLEHIKKKLNRLVDIGKISLKSELFGSTYRKKD